MVTTNHIDKLDAALLRPGRMDMHINMSYCKSSAFKQLVFNYLTIHDHELFDQIGELLQVVEVTPADVAGELLKSKNPTISLRGLVEFLKIKLQKEEMLKPQNGGPEAEEAFKDETKHECIQDYSEDLSNIVDL